MPVESLRAVPLADGRTAALYLATPPIPIEPGARLGWFMEMMFGPFDKPDMFVVATAKGMYEDGARNTFVWAEIEGQIASTVWTITPDDDPRLGSLGEVFTDPVFRGLGLARQTCSAILERFDARGGRCMFLGTDNPTAARIYRELGFEAYPAPGLGLMRRLHPSESGVFEAAWFARAGPVLVRPLRWGDIPRLVALYSAPNRWLAACYPQGFFSYSHVQHRRCNSLMKHTWQATRAGAWLGMFNAGGALVGSCPAFPRGNEREVIGGEVDLFVHNAYVADAPLLLGKMIDTLKERGWRWLMAQVPAGDAEKHDVLTRYGGFAPIATLPDALSIGGKTQDVIVLRASLS